MKIPSFRLSGILLLLITGATILSAQIKPKKSPTPEATPSCPMLSVSCPDSVAEGNPLTFTANVSGGDPNVTPTYNWTVSAGKISSGQGTSSITVDTRGLGEGTSITATVDIGGFDRSCSSSNSCTTSLIKKPVARKFDVYGKLNPEDENARLDNFAVALKNDPESVGYIITYGGRRSLPDEAQKMADSVGNYLTEKRGIGNARVFIGVGGYREEPTTMLWLASAGADPPLAEPTVDPSEVKPNKPTVTTTKIVVKLPQPKVASSAPKPKPKVKAGSQKTVDKYFYFNKALKCADDDCRIEMYTKALELDSTDVKLYLERGRSYAGKRSYEAAIQDFTTALGKGQELVRGYGVDLYYSRATAYYNSQKYEESIKDYSEAIKGAATFADAFRIRSKAYRRLGKTDLADADARRYQEITGKPAY